MRLYRAPMPSESEHVVRARKTDVTWRQVGDEVIVLDMSTWEYLGLNGTGAILWPALVEGATPEELRERLVDSYGIERERAAADVRAFLAALADVGLLEP
jgi:hypothetical protein